MLRYLVLILRIVVGFTGASGIIYGWRLVRILKNLGYDIWIVVTKEAVRVGMFECNEYIFEQLRNISNGFCYADNWDCPLSSGSFIFHSMVIVPCSLRTLAAIACGNADNVLVRAAINAIRLGRKLVLVVRETPWSSIDYENALKLSRLGVVVMPASPAFYHGPKNILDLVDYIVGRILEVLGIEHKLYPTWEEAKTRGPLNLCDQDA